MGRWGGGGVGGWETYRCLHPLERVVRAQPPGVGPRTCVGAHPVLVGVEGLSAERDVYSEAVDVCGE